MALPPLELQERISRWLDRETARIDALIEKKTRFIELLREFDADSAGVFWGRLNGRSLRWCSFQPRCSTADRRRGRHRRTG